MEIILSVLFLIVIWIYFKSLENRARDYRNSGRVDLEKMNRDVIFNNLSNTETNKNVLAGKYDKD